MLLLLPLPHAKGTPEEGVVLTWSGYLDAFFVLLLRVLAVGLTGGAEGISGDVRLPVAGADRKHSEKAMCQQWREWVRTKTVPDGVGGMARV